MFKLSKIHKLKLESLYLNLLILKISLWLNVIHEYSHITSVWSKALDYYVDDRLEEPVKLRHILNYICKEIYKDNAANRYYPNKPLFLAHTYVICDLLNIEKLRNFFPLDYRVKKVDRTSNADYKKERMRYKICHRVASTGSDIKMQYYDEYKHIANKYNWPLIYNSDDEY